MKLLVLALFFVATTSSFVNSLKCYDCTNTLSYKECDAQRKELTCDRNKAQDRCIKVDVSYTLLSQDITKFKKGCVTKEECSSEVNNMCKAAAYGTSKECNINCCSTDFCNAGSSLLVSIIILVTCVLGLFVLM